MDEEQRIKIENYRTLNRDVVKRSVLFTGSSLMEQFPIVEMCQSAGISQKVYNRGVGGFTTQDFLDQIEVQLLDLSPSKIFINIGTNDLNPLFGAKWKQRLLTNYAEILNIIRMQLPKTEVILLAYYPVNLKIASKAEWASEVIKVRNPENIREVNEDLLQLARRFGYRYFDANLGLTDEEGNLREEFTIDGIHMFAEAYREVFRNIRELI